MIYHILYAYVIIAPRHIPHSATSPIRVPRATRHRRAGRDAAQGGPRGRTAGSRRREGLRRNGRRDRGRRVLRLSWCTNRQLCL